MAANKTEAAIDAVIDRLRHAGVSIRRINTAPWIEDAEAKLGFRFRGSYRALVMRHSFPLLELERVTLFGNEGDGSEDDFTVAVFRDQHMSPWLAEHKLVHIGHPYIGNYDPICLDVVVASREPTVVRLDHEDILRERKRVHRAPVAVSFLALLQEVRGA